MATNIASEEENNDEAAWWIPDLQAPLFPLFMSVPYKRFLGIEQHTTD